MQLEWSRWLEGMTAFKAGQGLLWILVPVLYAVLWRRGSLKRCRLLWGSAVLGLLTVFPLSALVLLKGFSPFYDWMDLQQLMPLTLLTALFSVVLTEFLQEEKLLNGKNVKQSGNVRQFFSVVCVAVLLLATTNFHVFDYKSTADEHGVPSETAEAFDALYELVGDRQVVIVAKGDVLQYVRLYEPAWQPLYGRDLWSGKSASYINSGYDVEYEYYTLLEQAQLDDKERAEFTALLTQGEADLAIVPYYWREAYCQASGYELLVLTDTYNVIIKKDLMAE